jgi:large subunit ribosomal protein L34e
MPRPALRSRSLRRMRKRTPGGRLVLHYAKKEPGKHVCASCRRPLHGVPRGRKTRISRIPKTKKRPERPYGGNLCSSCMRKAIKERMIYKAGV